ncbi:MAG: hypothetical protein KDM64_14390, partial [Verrucomicrobiae bacterium]|nr:hypothetical protein [Verrucomicrobiae bacterium]
MHDRHAFAHLFRITDSGHLSGTPSGTAVFDFPNSRTSRLRPFLLNCSLLAIVFATSPDASATPANKKAFEKFFGPHLPAKLDSCA